MIPWDIKLMPCVVWWEYSPEGLPALISLCLKGGRPLLFFFFFLLLFIIAIHALKFVSRPKRHKCIYMNASGMEIQKSLVMIFLPFSFLDSSMIYPLLLSSFSFHPDLDLLRNVCLCIIIVLGTETNGNKMPCPFGSNIHSAILSGLKNARSPLLRNFISATHNLLPRNNPSTKKAYLFIALM